MKTNLHKNIIFYRLSLRWCHTIFYVVLFNVLLLLTPRSSAADIEITNLEVSWADTVVVIRPEIINPFNDDIWDALRLGVSVALDVEMRYSRTGYLDEIEYEIIVEHNVWEKRFRVITPDYTMTMQEYQTLLQFFKQGIDLSIPIQELPNLGPWFFSARISEGQLIHSIQADGQVESELNGITAWLFKWRKPKLKFSEWSDRVKLPNLKDYQETK